MGNAHVINDHLQAINSYASRTLYTFCVKSSPDLSSSKRSTIKILSALFLPDTLADRLLSSSFNIAFVSCSCCIYPFHTDTSVKTYALSKVVVNRCRLAVNLAWFLSALLVDCSECMLHVIE